MGSRHLAPSEKSNALIHVAAVMAGMATYRGSTRLSVSARIGKLNEMNGRRHRAHCA